jgi:hypothetical protein
MNPVVIVLRFCLRASAAPVEDFRDYRGPDQPGPYAVVRRPGERRVMFWDDVHAVWTTDASAAAVYRNQTVAASVAFVLGDGAHIRSLAGGQ